MSRLVLAAVFSLLAAPLGVSQTIPDLSFSDDGIVVSEQPGDGWALGAARLSGGASAVVGPIYDPHPGNFDVLGSFVSVYSPSGEPLESFGTDGTVRLLAGTELPIFSLRSVVQLADGRIALGGTAPKGPDESRRQAVVVMLTSSGAFDDSFGTGGILRLEPGERYSADQFQVRVVSTGTDVFVCGRFADSEPGATGRGYIARVRDGQVDPDYASLGYYLTSQGSTFQDCTVDNTGRVRAVGYFGGRALFTGLDANGDVDAGFGVRTRRLSSGRNAYARGINGLLVSGTAQNEDGDYVSVVWKLRSDGELDPDFADAGVLAVDLNEVAGGGSPLRPLYLQHGSVGLPFYQQNGATGTRLGVYVAWQDGTPDPDNGEQGAMWLFEDLTFRFVSDVVSSGQGGAYVALTLEGEPVQPALARIFVKIDPVSAEAAPGASLALTAAPNPTRGRTGIRLDLASPADAEVSVFDVLGRRVATLHDGPAAGELRAVWDASGVAPGAYVVVARVGDAVTTRRVSVVR